MQTWTTRKAEIVSPHGIIACQNRHAAHAGAAVLAKGGNAMDAAIVAALSLSVVEPWLSGIGGGGFLLHGDGRSGEVSVLDFNMIAPAGLDPDHYKLAGGDGGNWFAWPAVVGDRNITGYSSICVPGAIAGFAEALGRFGTLSFAEAVQPAIGFAERGLEIDWFTSLCLGIEASALAAFPASAALFLEDGRAPRAADGTPKHRPMPAKAALLRSLAAAGPRDFYEGDSARMMVADLQAGGSGLTLEDFAGFAPRWHKPLVAAYRGWEVNAVPGLSGGPSLLAALHELSATLKAGATPDATATLAYARAIRNAYQARLTSMGHAAPALADCTTHVSVVDRDGDMVSLTNTLLSRFGSKVTLPQSGILMNNGMSWFDPRPGQPNSIKAGTRPLANMCPLILSRAGKPALAIGAAGGRQIFPALAQLVSYLLDFGMSLEEAFHAPRMDASTPVIKVNRRAAADVAATVAQAYRVEIVDDTLYPVNFAVPSAVARDGQTGLNRGMAHPTNPWSDAAVGEPAHGG